jgi:hypothetical protein
MSVNRAAILGLDDSEQANGPNERINGHLEQVATYDSADMRARL